jgi:polyphosphate:AMP phosphotransferase
MFESAEVGNKIDKETYRVEAQKVRAALLAAQRELATADLALVIVFAGVEGAGKSETVNLLLEWLDARGVQTHALRDLSDEERERPAMWRFWRALPPRGRTGIFFGVWDARPLLDSAADPAERARLDRAIDRMVGFERMLTQENTLVVKFWLHLSKAAQKKRLKKLERDPNKRWRVPKEAWKENRSYDAFRSLSEDLVRRSDSAEAPWTVVESADKRYRNLTVARTLVEALRTGLARVQAAPAKAAPPEAPAPRPVNVLNQLDMSRTLGPKEYKKELKQGEARLNLLTRRLRKRDRSLILVFEGADAAGKGGAIRRLTAALDARDYRVISVAAPTDEERAHPYLWRFWRHLPPRGRVTIYDRSWYGRVLVERVEGFARPDEWKRAYGEINDFEAQLTEGGVVVVKFWLAISPEEQLRRFQDRQTTPYKQYKITPDDWRNRAKWDAYEAAACDMIEKTSTEAAPWVLVEAENKEWGRIKVMRAAIERLAEAVGQ